jgi:DNA-binding transcriptional LysR family regulator
MPHDIDLRKIDLNLLHVFEAIYASQNISRAATQLGMTQPTLSNALARLRDQFGDPLFLRADRGVRPSALAENLIEPVRAALAVLRQGFGTSEAFDPRSATRTFCLAMNDYTVITVLPPLLRKVDLDAPGIKITLVSLDTTEPYVPLLTGAADLALDAFTHAAPGIDLQPLDVIPSAVCIARKGHPRIKGTITAEMFGSVGHVAMPQRAPMRAHVETFFASYGISRRVVCEANNVSDIPALVASTDLIALLPVRFAHVMARHFDLQILPTPFASPTMRLQLGILQNRSADPGLQWLRRLLLWSTMQFVADYPGVSA